MRTVAVVLALVGLSAGEPQEKKKRDLKDRVEIPGTIVCIGCTLANQDGGAESMCTLHAKHAQGLLMSDGTLWTFVDNDRGHLVITNAKLRGKEVKIKGWKFAKTQYIEISKYEVKDGDKWAAYDFCKT